VISYFKKESKSVGKLPWDDTEVVDFDDEPD
jgi:hypothetical protein